ncbi:MAG: ATP-dependent metalloprotease, partial [Porticoccaceae bacterium]|nr:ATP-dependent metalloprotease [Porticoccaceae bacterium]
LYGDEESAIPGQAGKNFSGSVSQQIDEEVRNIVDATYGRAETLLKDNIDILHAMKEALMEYETLDSEQVDDLMARRKVRPPRDWHDFDHPAGGAEAGAEAGSADNPGTNIGGPVEDS